MIIDSLPFSFSPYLCNTEELVIGRTRAVDGSDARTRMACFQETKKSQDKTPHNLLKNFNWYKQFYTVYTHVT